MSTVPADAEERSPVPLSDCRWQTRWLVIALIALFILRVGSLFSRSLLSLLPWWLGSMLAALSIQLFLLVYPLQTRSPRGPLRIPSRKQLIVEFGVALCVVIGVFVALALIGFVVERVAPGKSLTPEALQQLAQSQQPWAMAMMAVFAIFVAPICEEIFFRGFLQNAFSARMPTALATLLQVTIFGAAHSFGLVHSIGAALIGLVLTAVYRWRKTLVTPMLVHSGANVIAFATLVAAAIAYANGPMLGVGGGPEDTRCVVRQIVPNSAAEKAGFQVGDIILRFNGVEVRDTQQLAELVRSYQVGDSIPIAIDRAGVELDLQAVLQRRNGS